MSYRQTPFALYEYYHVYNRGNSKQLIFKCPADYQRFQQLLFLCNTTESISFRNAQRSKAGLFGTPRTEPLVAIGAYALMPNHFHLLVTPIVEDGVSVFMQRLATAYVMYFNRKYDRAGSLFEGLFRSKHVDSDQYLKYLFAYTHLNPVRNSDRGRASVKEAIDYTYSSLSDYFDNERDERLILNPEAFPNYFSDIIELRSELQTWLKIGNDEEK